MGAERNRHDLDIPAGKPALNCRHQTRLSSTDHTRIRGSPLRCPKRQWHLLRNGVATRLPRPHRRRCQRPRTHRRRLTPCRASRVMGDRPPRHTLHHEDEGRPTQGRTRQTPGHRRLNRRLRHEISPPRELLPNQPPGLGWKTQSRPKMASLERIFAPLHKNLERHTRMAQSKDSLGTATAAQPIGWRARERTQNRQ